MSIGKIESVVTRGPTALVAIWDDGCRAEIDLSAIITARNVLAPLANPGIFNRIRIAEDGWSVEWPACGIDFGSTQLRRWADEQAA